MGYCRRRPGFEPAPRSRFTLSAGGVRSSDQLRISFPILLILGRAGFARGANVLSTGSLEDLFGAGNLVRIFRMDGDEDVAFLNLAFVTFGFEFWNAHADERPGEAAGGSADSGSAQGGHDRTGCDKRTHSR